MPVMEFHGGSQFHDFDAKRYEGLEVSATQHYMLIGFAIFSLILCAWVIHIAAKEEARVRKNR